jgi:hypothetical protein
MPTTLEFSQIDQVVRVPAPDTIVTIQEIWNQSQEWLHAPGNMDTQDFLSAGGKEDLGVGVQVGITLTLVNNWRVEFEPRLGPGYEGCIVEGGNLVAENSFSNNPIKPSAFTQVVIQQSSSPTIVETGGTGLTEAESTTLAVLEKLLRNKTITDPITGTITVYESDGSTVLFTANIFEDSTGLVAYGPTSEQLERRERLV